MRILVTGLSGFTGGYVKQALINRGHEVMGLESDLLDERLLSQEIASKKPQAVVHLAAVAFVAHGHAADFYRVNVVGTLNLLAALYQCCPNIDAVLLASSANVYGNQSVAVLDESCALQPANDYAVSKVAMEKMASLWQDRLPITIARPFNYTGVGQKAEFLIPKIVDHFRRRADSIRLGNLDVSREFNDVRFVAEVYADLIESNGSKQALNVCTGKAYALQAVIDLCQQITGHSLGVVVDPRFVRDNEVKVLAGSDRALRRLISVLPEYQLEQTLAWMLQESICSI